MIIRTTIRDNDYTQYLEEYWDNFWFKAYYTEIEDLRDKEDIESVKKFVKQHDIMEELLDKAFYNEKELTISELGEFEKYLYNSIALYLMKYHRVPSNLIKNLKVNVMLNVKDIDENGEVVYYFLKHKKYITM